MPIEQRPSDPPGKEGAHHLRLWLDYRRKRFWAVLVVLLYGLVGFFVVPPILQRQIVSSAQKTLDRPVTLASVGFNPLILSADLRGFAVKEKDGSPLLAFDRLYIRFSVDSLLHWAWSFGQIRLEGLKGDAIRYSATDTNIGRLIQSLKAQSGPAKPAKEDDTARVIVHHLSIQNAKIAFTDHVPDTPFTTEIGPVNAEIDRFSTLPDKTGQQHIVIDLEKGAVLELISQSSLEPLNSIGHIKTKGPYAPLIARYFGGALPFSVPAGAVETELDYHLQERPDGTLSAAVEHLSLAVNDLALQETNAQTPFVTLPHVRLAGGHLKWPEREVGADSLTVEGFSVALRQQEDGKIVPILVPATAPAPAPQASDPSAEWSLSLGKIEVKNAKAQFEDQRMKNGGKIEIASFDLTTGAVSNKQDANFPFSMTTSLAPSGTVKLEGTAAVLPKAGMDAKLMLTDLPIALGQTYLHDVARLAIEDGKLSGNGEVKLTDPDGLKIVGSGEIRSMKLTDEADKTPVVAWDHLTIDRYVYRQAKNDLQISQVTLGNPFFRFQKAADQSTNFSHILVPAASTTSSSAAAKATAAPMTISIGKIAVEGGSGDYADASLPLPFATHITNLQGKISTLNSSAASASSVSLHGQVDQYGELNIYGKVNPFHAGTGMKLNVDFRNVSFPGLSPYSAKFAGRRIAKGSLDVESQYAIDEGQMKGKNRIVIRDLELGERIDVPGALDLPLDLAISLLKDSEGKIDVDIPVGGNVNDPQFDFGAVISKEIFDMLSELVTAPFRMLAGLFGGDSESLGHIDFIPGRADLDPPEKEKIQHIAEALNKRPNLSLVVAGVMDPETDRHRLQHDALDTEMAKELGDHDMVSRQRKFLEQLFEKRIGKDKLAAVKQPFGTSGDSADFDDPAYISALRKEVAKTEPVDDATLAALAKSRGDNVAAALKQVPGFNPKRVVQHDAKPVKTDDDSRIQLPLEIANAN